MYKEKIFGIEGQQKVTNSVKAAEKLQICNICNFGGCKKGYKFQEGGRKSYKFVTFVTQSY